MEFPGGELDEKDIEAIEVAIDWLDEKVEEIQKKYGNVQVLKEVSFDLTVLHDGLWGTSDIVIHTTDFSYLGVFDYKHGTHLVEAEANVQLLYYLLGAVNYLGHSHLKLMGWGGVYRDMEIGIIQPRGKHYEGAVRTVTVDALEVEAYAQVLQDKAGATRRADALFSSGSWCRWCRAKPNCPMLYQKTQDIAKTDFADIRPKPPAVTGLTNGQIGNIMDNEEIFTAWLKSVKALAQQKLERGESVPGFKLVKRRVNRSWTDAERAAGYMYENGFPDHMVFEQKMKSPAKMEKLLSKEAKADLAKFIEKKDNGHTIAKESDRRQELPALVETDFKVITKGNKNE